MIEWLLHLWLELLPPAPSCPRAYPCAVPNGSRWTCVRRERGGPCAGPGRNTYRDRKGSVKASCGGDRNPETRGIASTNSSPRARNEASRLAARDPRCVRGVAGGPPCTGRPHEPDRIP